MAHQLTQRKNGFIEFAATGPRTEVWHGLGQYLEEGASIDVWKEQAGMDWQIERTPVMFDVNGQTIQDDTRHVLYRNDNQAVLGVMSKDYRIVQPGEVLEFFRDLTEDNKMHLSAAGTLFNGSRYWATAKTNHSAEIVAGDKIDGYLLLVSSADGTLSTFARFTSTRVVCNNTLQVALNGKTNNAVKVTHAANFDAKKVKIDLGLLDEAWDGFIGNLRKMAETSVTDDQAEKFFLKLITPKDSAIDMELLKTQRHLDAMMHFYKNGSGAEYSNGTAWGLLNSVTEMATHGTDRRDRSAQFIRSELGQDNIMKNNAYSTLLEML